MSDNGIKAIMQDDGTFKVYDDTYDIIIHCQSLEEQEKVEKILSKQYVSIDTINKIITQINSRLDGVNIALDVLQKDDPLVPKMEAAKTSLEECLSIIHQFISEEAADAKKEQENSEK